MKVRNAEAQWHGTLREGSGTMKLGSGAYEGRYTYASRFEDEKGTNPEELIGAAHAGCFTMYLAGQLANAGFPATSLHTTASVTLGSDDVGPVITSIELDVQARVPEIGVEEFKSLAQRSKERCPVSRALESTNIVLSTTLID
ncbi:MAG: OsmC family protein [Candidatus Promineifilaceae bacterium]|nr:OsmC family protein [Candidatus Promineifilaceae bacterium]